MGSRRGTNTSSKAPSSLLPVLLLPLLPSPNALRTLTIVAVTSTRKTAVATRLRGTLIERRNRRNRRTAFANWQHNLPSTASTTSDSSQSWTLSSRGDSPPPHEYVAEFEWEPHFNRLFTTRIHTSSPLYPVYARSEIDNSAEEDHIEDTSIAKNNVEEASLENHSPDEDLSYQHTPPAEEEEPLEVESSSEDVSSEPPTGFLDPEQQISPHTLKDPPCIFESN